MTDDQAPAPRRLAYHQYDAGDLTAARERFEELTAREMDARLAATLRGRGEFNPDDEHHARWAATEPLSADDHCELMAAGEVLARYYRHPAMLDHAAKAGASWDAIGAARGTSADQARRDYIEWAEGQHNLHASYDGRFGLSDDEYAAALARAGQDAGAAR